jgi:sugar-specific transcriptional regulator TrmB
MLNEAIISYGKYTDNQRKVFCALVDLAVGGVVYASVKKLHEVSGVASPTVYAILKVLQIDGIIVKDMKQKGIFRIQQDKIDFLINAYKKQLATSN